MSMVTVEAIPGTLQELLPAIVAELAWLEGTRTCERDVSWTAVNEGSEALGRLVDATISFERLHRGIHAMERNQALAADEEYGRTMERQEVIVIAAVLRLRYLRRALREGVRA